MKFLSLLGLNPYALIAGGLVIAGIAGTFWYQSGQIHEYHAKFDAAQLVIDEENQTIKGMTEAQNNQTSKTEANIIKVIQPPATIQTVIKEINSAPVSKDCKAPVDSKEVQNSF